MVIFHFFSFDFRVKCGLDVVFVRFTLLYNERAVIRGGWRSNLDAAECAYINPTSEITSVNWLFDWLGRACGVELWWCVWVRDSVCRMPCLAWERGAAGTDWDTGVRERVSVRAQLGWGWTPGFSSFFVPGPLFLFLLCLSMHLYTSVSAQRYPDLRRETPIARTRRAPHAAGDAPLLMLRCWESVCLV